MKIAVISDSYGSLEAWERQRSTLKIAIWFYMWRYFISWLP